METVTQSTVVAAHLPGTGKSFGQIALEVLRDARRAGYFADRTTL